MRGPVEVAAKHEPWHHIIKNRHALIVKSARRIIKTLIDSAEDNVEPPLPTIIGPLQAAYTLVVYILSHSGSRLVESALNVGSVQRSSAIWDVCFPGSHLFKIIPLLRLDSWGPSIHYLLPFLFAISRHTEWTKNTNLTDTIPLP